MIYLDNSATTKPYAEVLQAYHQAAEQYFANPSSLHEKGAQAQRLLEQARAACARQLNVREEEIVFTSGGTESTNLAIKGVAFFYKNRGRHIVTTATEHAATYETCRQLEKWGFEVTYLRPKENGVVTLQQVQQAIRPDTILVSLIHVNNELGTVTPIERIGKVIKEQHSTVLFHVDHVQGVAKVPLSFQKANIDLATMSGHKFHGVKGAGLLYVRKGVQLVPQLSGGGQEGGRRSGTENVPAYVALAKALRMTMEKSESGNRKLIKLRDCFCQAVAEMDGVVITTPEKTAAPHIVNVSVPGVRPEVVVHALKEDGIYVSTKSACSSKEEGPSRVLQSAGIAEEVARSALRFSFSYDTTEEEIDAALRSLQKHIPHLRSVMRSQSKKWQR